MGDFNGEPHVIEGPLRLNQMDAVCLHTGSITCRAQTDSVLEKDSGTNIEFAVISGAFQTTHMGKISLDRTLPTGRHSAVRMDIGARDPSGRARVLVAQAKMAATLPIGPVPPPPCYVAVNGDLAALWQRLSQFGHIVDHVL